MKTKTKVTIIVLFFTGFYVYMLAAPPTPTIPPTPLDVCVTIAPADHARVTEAFGSILGLKDASGNPRPATIAEISDATAIWIGSQTSDYERRKNQASFTPPPFSSGSGKLNPASQAGPTATPKKK